MWDASQNTDYISRSWMERNVESNYFIKANCLCEVIISSHGELQIELSIELPFHIS